MNDQQAHILVVDQDLHGIGIDFDFIAYDLLLPIKAPTPVNGFDTGIELR